MFVLIILVLLFIFVSKSFGYMYICIYISPRLAQTAIPRKTFDALRDPKHIRGRLRAFAAYLLKFAGSFPGVLRLLRMLKLHDPSNSGVYRVSVTDPRTCVLVFVCIFDCTALILVDLDGFGLENLGILVSLGISFLISSSNS